MSTDNTLIAKAQELQIEVPENATEKEIVDLIKVAEHPILTENLAEANEIILGLEDDLKAEIQKNTKKVPVDLLLYKSKKGISYELKVPSFRFQGEKHISKEVNTNVELMEALIKAKFIHLKQLEDE
ncbi:hypothetical protein G1K66_08495 [Tenacibaculum finnmarkense]|uniref:Uncharacterized protein n=1 Tax=Tenacibaculum finnmarkense genomovar ulcerans TaxID=2781388 RepID=A0A2I2MA99_9FLAO|nr:hypothetical protein [Tenacibaculum finnmarkense]MBE7688447.1 hypothetical protein [Tenacibaculum finnmarkense genomovar ulcerans]MCD8430398.1 hypothetical protein [Tenacibaculum finnmarkense genomovar ulcerans]MCG8813299.1 hypothetical protein [Tenacibaculum finnmarkense]SOU89473.1 conserved hypothetical protein [Tenacibaculum finnmarkense genomovar ulcerans]